MTTPENQKPQDEAQGIATLSTSDGLGRRMRIFLRFGKYMIFATGIATIFIPVMLGICLGLDWLLGKWMILVPIGGVAGFCLLGAWADETTKDKSP